MYNTTFVEHDGSGQSEEDLGSSKFHASRFTPSAICHARQCRVMKPSCITTCLPPLKSALICFVDPASGHYSPVPRGLFGAHGTGTTSIKTSLTVTTTTGAIARTDVESECCLDAVFFQQPNRGSQEPTAHSPLSVLALTYGTVLSIRASRADVSAFQCKAPARFYGRSRRIGRSSGRGASQRLRRRKQSAAPPDDDLHGCTGDPRPALLGRRPCVASRREAWAPSPPERHGRRYGGQRDGRGSPGS
jgi:hypothetical protein